MNENPILEILKLKYQILKNEYTEHEAYDKISEEIKTNEHFNSISQEEINKIVVKPKQLYSIDQLELPENEDGDTYGDEYSEVSNKGAFLDLIPNFGWLENSSDRKKLLRSTLYKDQIRIKLGSMPEFVKKEIDSHSLHILGRCNNPKDWGTHNKQGLVYGMVQSGKTASMISLVGLAIEAGYRLFILLSGDKNSLRDQTQDRVNSAFDLNLGGYNTSLKLNSLTTKGNDYNDNRDNHITSDQFWEIHRHKNETFIIVIKKNKNNLLSLIKDIKSILKNSFPNPAEKFYEGFSFEKNLKTMIIDDEADYASQDTRPREGGSAIHNELVELRMIIPKNCYVAYTATPQACIAADPKKLVGYPNDFLWHIDPHRDEEGNTTTYLGLEEFFKKYPKYLTPVLPNKVWPHYKKDSETAKKLGIYDDKGKEIESNLNKAEKKHIGDLIEHVEKGRYNEVVDYANAIIDYLIGCGIRWYRHYAKLKKEGKIEDKPSTREIETTTGQNPFPYHAMMINLSLITDTHNEIRKFIELVWIKIIDPEWKKVKRNKWKNNNDIFKVNYDKQLDKSFRFDKQVPNPDELQHFIEKAFKITKKPIFDVASFIYILNSKDEGSTLRYTGKRQNRCKKAAIIIGGNILSRGLTIENLSVTFYARSQINALEDTNLQMCRWFGHKRPYIDLVSTYIQKHSVVLFEDITICDYKLRMQFIDFMIKDTPGNEAIIELINTPQFKATNPQKAKNLLKSKYHSFSGRTDFMLKPFSHNDCLRNNELLDRYVEDLGVGNFMHNRAWVYKNVDPNQFLYFFEGLNFDKSAMNVNPKTYCNYLKEWTQDDNSPDLPKIHIGISGWDEEKQNKPRKRQRRLNVKNPINADEMIKEATDYLTSFEGANDRPKEYFTRDRFMDKDKNYHIEARKNKRLKRDYEDGILILFYKIDSNYVGKLDSHVYFPKGHKKYIDTKEPGITFLISTPKGGPSYTSYKNRLL